MSKRTSKVALTYILTIIFTLVAAALVCGYAFSSLLSDGGNDDGVSDDEIVQLEPMTVLGSYEPTAKDSKTLLLILDAEKRESGSCFLIARFLPTEKKVVLLPLPSNTLVADGEENSTLYNVYRNNGTKKTVSAVEACLNISVDKYIKFNRSSFSVIADIFGSIDYIIPYNLVYDNPDTGEATVIKSGSRMLDSTDIRKVLTYPNYTQGEEYRTQCLGIIANELITKGTTNAASFADNLDDYFVAIINSDIDTDITAYDYDDIDNALKYVIRNSTAISSFILSSGSTNEDGQYVIDEKFLATLPEQLMTNQDE